ncbi:UNVERIFIED_CONTAM: hypothetical protein FKN15_064939 [Acipenser sinensis]
MFYGSSASMSLPSKKKLKRQSRTFTQVLYRTLRYRDRRSATDISDQVADDPAELSTQTSVPGVLKIFGDEICMGANYKSVLATPRSSAQELVKEALERYSLNKAAVCKYLLCDVIGRFEGADKRWRTECLRALGDNEKPLLLQDLWKPKEGFARRFELRRRAEVEEMAAREKDTVTADINAQARKLQRNRAKGTTTLSPGESFCRSLSETSLNLACGPGDEPKRYYSTLPGLLRGRAGREGSHHGRKKKEEREGGGVRHSLYHSPHLLLLQGFNQRNDCLVYPLNRDQHTVGQETASARPNICLSSPDVLQLHCKIKKIQVVRRFSQTVEERLVVEPLPQASVLINFSRADRTSQLRHGDLLSFGAHYIFLYKDPVSAKPLPTQTLSRLKILFQLPEPELDLATPLACKMCGSVFKEKQPQQQQQPVRRSFKPHLMKSKSLQGKKLHLDFEKAQEDELIGRIISLIEPGSKVSLLSTAISANEEAMTILEEVIMYTFQQCVYYITKSLYISLPGLLECNPFQAENSDPCWRGGSPALPEPVRKVVLIYQTTLDLLQQYQVHSEVQSQMFAYLFFFTNVSLFNQLLDKGPLRGWFHWSRGVQIQGSLRLVLEWAGNVGLSHLAEEFFSKFSSAVSLLATPTLQLVQMTWKSLCSDYPALKPAQLHHLLTKYQLAPDAGPVLAWQPSPDEEAQIYRTVDLVESFENHPPIVLPSSGFQVDFESDTVDDNIYRQLLYVRHFLWSLRAKSPSTNGSTDSQELQREPLLSHSSPRPAAPIGHSTPTNHHHTGSHLETQLDGIVSVVSSLSSGPRDGQCHEDRLKEKLNHMGRNSSFLQSMQPLDPSCLLTSPNTPLYTDFSQQDSSPLNRGGRTIHDINKGLNGFTVSGVEGNSNGVIDFPTSVSSSLSSAADDFCYIFIVELDKGPFGLGMGLIDGLHTPLNAPGIYIRTLIPDGPAASDGRLNIGDRILAVNGTSLIGADYQR